MSLTLVQSARPHKCTSPGEPRRGTEARRPVYTLTNIETHERHDIENPEQLAAALQLLILRNPDARFDLLVSPRATAPCESSELEQIAL